MVTQSETADAVPSFARQTGYYCSTCHTVQPELTPFGRQFKLNGYTQGGTRCGDIRKIFGSSDPSAEWTGANLSSWILPSFNNFAKAWPSPPAPGMATNNIWDFSDATMFFNGQIYCNLGVFAQFSYSSTGRYPNNTPSIFLDNTELRYTEKVSVAGNDVVLGVFGNNNPSMQDVWNTAPAWIYPWVPIDVTYGPPGTMVEGTFAQRAYGAGFYAWVNSMFYAELSAYRGYDAGMQAVTGFSSRDGQPNIDGLAPYWRLAIEKTWNEQSLMFGTYGMAANLIPTNNGFQVSPGLTDRYTDVALDLQYQYIGAIHAFTARAYYIWENQDLTATFANTSGGGVPGADHPNQWLNSFNVSASYIYDRHYSFTADYFNVTGSYDLTLWPGALSSVNGRPNTEGVSFDLSYVPFPYGGPDLWPWLNARIGIVYTHFATYAGSSANWDGNGRSARDNDQAFVYSWIDF